MAASGQSFNPKNTNISEDKLSNFLQEKITGDIEEVPGIGPANKRLLAEAGVGSTYQLLGKYLTFKEGSIQEHQDTMYNWLKSIGVNSGRGNIVLAMAEKCDILLEGVFDITLYD